MNIYSSSYCARIGIKIRSPDKQTEKNIPRKKKKNKKRVVGNRNILVVQFKYNCIVV